MKKANRLLPWQQSQWRVLQQRKANASLPHALLLFGQAGLGKQQFAMQFAASLLCSQPLEIGEACGKCRGCQLIQAGNHPDLISIMPEQEGKAIKVDQIRQLVSFLDKTAQFNGFKVVVIQPADRMNINAANALLKTLEEPSDNTVIILLTHRLMALPATVRSRCQIIPFSVPDEQEALRWLASQKIDAEQLPLLLAFAKGAPLKVLELIEQDELTFRETIFNEWCDFIDGKLSLVELSGKWHSLDLNRLLMHLTSWVMDMIRIKQLEDEAFIVNKDIMDRLSDMAKRWDKKKLFVLYDDLNKMQHGLNSQINLNPQLMIEGWLSNFY